MIAEKFQAMVQLGSANSRMNDFYDIWLLSQSFDFVGSVLQLAVSKTFENRKTSMETEPLVLTVAFAESSQPAAHWAAFEKRSKIEGCPAALVQVVKDLRVFLLPLAESVVDQKNFDLHWSSLGPWK